MQLAGMLFALRRAEGERAGSPLARRCSERERVRGLRQAAWLAERGLKRRATSQRFGSSSAHWRSPLRFELVGRERSPQGSADFPDSTLAGMLPCVAASQAASRMTAADSILCGRENDLLRL
jgi:hypothetical protein